MTPGTLYLISTPIGEFAVSDEKNRIIPILQSVRFFVIEEVRTARRFMKSIDPNMDINACTFREFNEHNRNESTDDIKKAMLEGTNIAIMSEAGNPCIADPGSEVVMLAHQCGMKVIPVGGTSSLMMALMCSGLNGQRFMFHGYLPVKKDERIKELRNLEQRIGRDQATQIFIEAPYRNRAMLEDIVNSLNPETYLSVSAGLETPEMYICTKTIKDWKKELPELHKIPAVFVIGR